MSQKLPQTITDALNNTTSGLIWSDILIKNRYTPRDFYDIFQSPYPDFSDTFLDQYFYGRVWVHIWRLVHREQEEVIFASALFDFLLNKRFHQVVFQEIPGFKVVYGEGYDTLMFWTLAPFIYKYLFSDTCDDSERILQSIFDWAASGDTVESLHYDPGISLHGLEELNYTLQKTWILDPANPLSYELADMTAQYLVDNGFIPLTPSES